MPIDRRRTGIIPWESRAKIGFIRAFWRTAIAAVFTPARFSRASVGTVDLRSARSFRWISCLLLSLTVSAVFVFEICDHGGIDCLETEAPNSPFTGPGSWQFYYTWVTGAMVWPILPLGFMITVVLMTGIAHWFYSRRFELIVANRAMVLSYYFWLPFVCSILMVALLGMFYEETSRLGRGMTRIQQWVSPLVVLLIIVITFNGFRAIKSAIRCGAIRMTVTFAGIFIQSILAIVLGLIVFPIVVGLFILGIGSLRR